MTLSVGGKKYCTYPFLCTHQVSAATFATYVYIDEKNVLDAEKAFVGLTLFNLMRFPMALFPMFMTSIIEVWSLYGQGQGALHAVHDFHTSIWVVEETGL